jgi:hypothetical protein
MAEKVGSGTAAHPVEVQPESAHVPEDGCGETVIECADATGAVDVQGDGARGRGRAPPVVRGEELLLLLLLDLDEFDRGREQPVRIWKKVLCLSDWLEVGKKKG